MAYADNQEMSTGRIGSIILVVLLHAFLGYAFVTGLAYEAVKKAAEKLNVVDVQEEKPPEEEPPPPPPDNIIPPPPPVFAKESPIKNDNKSKNTTQDTQKKQITETFFNCNGVQLPTGAYCAPAETKATCWDGSIIIVGKQSCPKEPDKTKTCPTGAVVPINAECPKPVAKRPNPIPKGSPANWATTDDYPQSAISQEKQGTTGFSVTVGPNGRVTSCSVTSSSGTPSLDSTTCSKVTSRARFDPALDSNGNPTTGSYSNRIRWVLPKD
jgi:periplasmic protein TonB